MNMKFFYLIISVFLINVGIVKAYNINDYGANPTDSADDTDAIQACINAAATAQPPNNVAYIPSCGTNESYILSKHLLIPSNVVVYGNGNSSLITIPNITQPNGEYGKIRALKNGGKYFYYQGYSNEGGLNGVTEGTLSSAANTGNNNINITVVTGTFSVNDWITLFDNNTNMWSYLEYGTMQQKNGSDENVMPKGEVAKITAINGNTITLNTNLAFSYPAGSTVMKHSGSVDSTLRDFKIINNYRPSANPVTGKIDNYHYTIDMERPLNFTFDNLTIDASGNDSQNPGLCGGIMLTHYAYLCTISNCHITMSSECSDRQAPIFIADFSEHIDIEYNTIDFYAGYDGAIIAQVACNDIDIYYNTINCYSDEHSCENAILIHSFTHGCYIHDNYITGGSAGLSVCFGSYSNSLQNNYISNTRQGAVLWYAGLDNYVGLNDFSFDQDIWLYGTINGVSSTYSQFNIVNQNSFGGNYLQYGIFLNSECVYTYASGLYCFFMNQDPTPYFNSLISCWRNTFNSGNQNFVITNVNPQ